MVRFFPSNTDVLVDQIRSGKVKALLLYGNDSGLIDSVYEKISKALNYSERFALFSDLSASSICCILDSLNLFAEKELIKIAEVASPLEKDIFKIIEGSNFTNFPVFIAKDGSNSALIKKPFEVSSCCVAIGCYVSENLNSMIDTHLRGYLIDRDAKQYLLQNLPHDYGRFVTEVEKLKIFFSNKLIVGIDQLQKILSNSTFVSLDEIFISLAKGDWKEYFAQVSLARQQGVSDMLIIRTLIRYYLNLAFVLCSEKPLRDSVSGLRPPIFFKYIEAFVEIAGSASKASVRSVLEALYAIEKKLKYGTTQTLLESLFFTCKPSNTHRTFN